MQYGCSSYEKHIWKEGQSCRDCGKHRNYHSTADDDCSTVTLAQSAGMNESKSMDVEQHSEGGSSASRNESGAPSPRSRTSDDDFTLVFDRKGASQSMETSCDSDTARVNNILDGTVKVRNLLDGTTSLIQDGPDTQQANLREVIKAQMHEIERLKSERIKDRSEIVERIETLESSPPASRRVSGKVVVVGSAAIGKTSLINRFIYDDFSPTGSTIACDSCQKAMRVDDAMVNLLIYDTAGQERFAGLTSQYFRLGDACLICVDLSEDNCLIAGRIDWWRNEVKRHNINCAVVLVGTKSDLASEHEVQQAAYYAKSTQMPFFKTSAKEGYLGTLFYHVAECVLRRRAETKLAEHQLLVTAHGKRKESTCCA